MQNPKTFTHEIWVRPVVRYVLTEYWCDDEALKSGSVAFGEFESVRYANRIAESVARDTGAICEPARGLKIEWERGPGEPKDAIRWTLRETGDE